MENNNMQGNSRRHLFCNPNPNPTYDDSSGYLKMLPLPPSSGFPDKAAPKVEVDSLLADAGYSVKTSDLPILAQRLEQLDTLMVNSQDGGLTHLSSDTVHYNPSDMYGWVDGLLGEFGGDLLGGPDGTSCLSDYQMPPSSAQDQYALDMDTSPVSESFKFMDGPCPMDSIPQLMKDAATAASPVPPRKHRLLYDEAEFSDYNKLMEDQISSNQISSLYQNVNHSSMQDVFPQGLIPVRPSSIGISSMVPSLQAKPQALRSSPKSQQSPPEMRKKPKLSHPGVASRSPSSGPTSSHSSDGRVPNYQQKEHKAKARAYSQAQQQPLQPQNPKSLGKSILSPSASITSPFQAENSTKKEGVSTVAKKKKELDPVAQNKLQNAHIIGESPSPTVQVPHPGIIFADVSDDSSDQAESGVLLVQLLMACADAIQKNELGPAGRMQMEISKLVSTNYTGAMGKVARHFAEALSVRIHGIRVDDWPPCYRPDPTLVQGLYEHFYECCPYLKFSHFMANQAILEAFEGQKVVHVIDFNLMKGLQWPALIQALAVRPGGPPRFRMTGIGPPQPDKRDILQEVGMDLARLANDLKVEFSFRGVVATKLDDVKPWMFEVQPGEAIAVNSIFQLHRLLDSQNPNGSVSPVNAVLRLIRSLNPNIVTIVEQEANHNIPVFIERFVEALHYYSTMFDSLEACDLPPDCDMLKNTEIYLGREIMNIVACEGSNRVERHEPLTKWRDRMLGADFRPSHLGSNAYKQASLLLSLFNGEGYTVQEDLGCLTLGWHSRPLIAASAWQCG